MGGGNHILNLIISFLVNIEIMFNLDVLYYKILKYSKIKHMEYACQNKAKIVILCKGEQQSIADAYYIFFKIYQENNKIQMINIFSIK